MNNVTRKECQETKTTLMKEIKLLKKDVSDIKVNIAKLPEKLRETFDKHYVSKDSFKPIQKVVYGLVGAILLGIVVALLALVIR